MSKCTSHGEPASSPNNFATNGTNIDAEGFEGFGNINTNGETGVNTNNPAPMPTYE